MTVPVQNPFNSYNANGVTTQFRYEFLIKDASDLSVTLDGAVVDRSKYTLTNIGQSNGGNVNFTTAPAAGLLILRRAVIPQRLTDYQDNGPLRAEDINRDLDRLVMMIQDKQADTDTALKHPLGQNGTTVPFTYDLTNGRIINAADPVDDGDLVNKGYVDQLFTDQAAAAIKQAEDARDAAIAARNAAQASQQAAASSQTAASGSQTAAKTSETNAATSAQQAAASASAAASSQSTASAAAGTATGAATTATQAASGATQQATQASASATTAGQQATAAAGSASAAAGSASSAASAMTAAQSAQQAAEVARDSIINIAPGNYVLKTNNLSDLSNKATARTNLELNRVLQRTDSTILQSSIAGVWFYVNSNGEWGVSTDANRVPLPIASGGTGATTAAGAVNNFGLGPTNDVAFRRVFGRGGGYSPAVVKEANQATADVNGVNQISFCANPGASMTNYIITIPNDSHQYVWSMAVPGQNDRYFSMRTENGIYTPEGRCQIAGSDVRLKDQFEPIKAGSWERVEQIGLMEFYYRGNPVPQRGYLAQQMGDIDDMYVFEGGTAHDVDGKPFEILNVNDRAVVADLIIVVQELQKAVGRLAA